MFPVVALAVGEAVVGRVVAGLEVVAGQAVEAVVLAVLVAA